MSNNNFRNAELLKKLEHNPLKKQLARALDASEIFAGDVEYLSLNKDLSPQGLDNARRAKLRAAVRDNRDARSGVNDLKAKLEVKRAAVTRPPLDRKDQIAVDDRRELRTILRGMDRGQRALLLSGAGADAEFVDAMLEVNPIISGLMPEEKFIVDAAREQRLAGLFGPQLAEIEELETTIAEANGIFDLSLVDMKLHSGLDDQSFTELVAPIMNRKNAPWLKCFMEEGKEVIRVIDTESHRAAIATPDQIRDGKYYKDHAEYLADRAA